MLEKRTFRPRNRLSGVRDAKLIVIATEDTKATPKYFEDLKEFSRNTRVKVHIVNHIDMPSSLGHVIKSLDDFRREHKLESGDELWMVIDVDTWGAAKLSQIATQCSQKRYILSVSNPCFEIWLLLHLKSIDDYDDITKSEFLENHKDGTNRGRLERELVALLGGYNKSNLDTKSFIHHVHHAIQRAKAIDANPADRWPQTLGTRIYLLAEKILPS